MSLLAEPETTSILQFAVDVAAAEEFVVSLRADREKRLSAMDARQASYILRSISFS